jgi:hypothetical protein
MTSNDEWRESPFYVADRRPVPVDEVTELADAVDPNRWDEFAAIVRLGNSTSSLDSQVVCLAAVIDIPGTVLASWPRFQHELEHPPSYMWGDAVYELPPDQSVLAPGLSHDSRLLLASLGGGGVTYRRSASEMKEKYLFDDARLTRVRDELCANGLAIWGAPSTQEAVSTLPAADLEALFAELPVKKSWTKARKLEVLFEQIDDERLRAFVLTRSPLAFEETLNIRYESPIDEEFHLAWADLTGHFIDSCAYRDRDWDDLQTEPRVTGRFGERFSSPGPMNDCDRCEDAARRIDINDKVTWPPFHLGCRCAFELELDLDL